MRYVGSILIVLALLLQPAAAAEPVLRIAVLKVGTVNWLMSTIKEHRLDAAAGYRLDVVGLASGPATKIAFQSGDTDVLVTDWVWAMRQRGTGKDLHFAPYSVSLGALMSLGKVTGLCDLKSRKVGVVGGELDKSWLVLQALTRQRCGFELSAETQAVFGAPPLMSRQLETGIVDAISTYWHWAAKLDAAGANRVLDITDALVALGVSPAPPLIGFVWDAGGSDPALVSSFLASVAAARKILAADDAEWDRLRPLMKARDDAEFETLRDYFRRGIPAPWSPEHTRAAKRLHRLLIENAGAVYAGDAGPFDPALFDVPAHDG